MTITECPIECASNDNDHGQHCKPNATRRSNSVAPDNEASFSLSFKNPVIEKAIKSNKVSVSEQTNSVKVKPKLDHRQIMVLLTLAYGNFWVAACVSLQAPFFPKEAELKGKICFSFKN